MVAALAIVSSLPAEQLALLCGLGPFFVLLFAAFLVSHVNEARKYPGPGL